MLESKSDTIPAYDILKIFAGKTRTIDRLFCLKCAKSATSDQLLGGAGMGPSARPRAPRRASSFGVRSNTSWRLGWYPINRWGRGGVSMELGKRLLVAGS